MAQGGTGLLDHGRREKERGREKGRGIFRTTTPESGQGGERCRGEELEWRERSKVTASGH